MRARRADRPEERGGMPDNAPAIGAPKLPLIESGSEMRTGIHKQFKSEGGKKKEGKAVMTPHPTRWYQCYHTSINWWENSPTITYLEKNILCAEENSKHYIWRSMVVASSCYGVLLSGRDEDTGHNWGEWLLQPNKERSLKKTWTRLHKTGSSSFSTTVTRSIQPRRRTSPNVFEWPGQSPNFNPMEHLGEMWSL